MRKFAYGAPVVEIVFGKQELMSLCRDAGLRLEREWPCIPYDVSEVTGHRSSDRDLPVLQGTPTRLQPQQHVARTTAAR